MKAKGQDFITFRMVIAFAIGLMVLALIMMTVYRFAEQKKNISERMIFDGMRNAVSAPGVATMDTPLVLDKIAVEEGQIITKKGLSFVSGLNEECMSIYSVIAREAQPGGIEFVSNHTYRVYIVCLPTVGECPVKCSICFDLDPREGACPSPV